MCYDEPASHGAGHCIRGRRLRGYGAREVRETSALHAHRRTWLFPPRRIHQTLKTRYACVETGISPLCKSNLTSKNELKLPLAIPSSCILVRWHGRDLVEIQLVRPRVHCITPYTGMRVRRQLRRLLKSSSLTGTCQVAVVSSEYFGQGHEW